MNKKYNIVLFLLFIVYLFGYFSISKTLIPIMCVIQVFLIEHIFRVRNRIMQIGEIIIIVASIILFIDVYWVCNKRLLYKIKFSIYLLKPIYFFYYLLSLSLNLTDIYCWYSLSTYNLKVNTLRKSLQTTSALPCRTQVQPEASFLVCSLIFIEYNLWLVSQFALSFSLNFIL